MKKLSFIFVTFCILYLATSAGPTPYDYFTRLANSLLKGYVHLTENPPWLNELITLGPSRYTFVNPPMPGILAVPFVAILGSNFQQQYLAHILGAGIVVITYLLSLRIKQDKKVATWVAVSVGIGSILWYMSSTGSVWYLGQITAFFFMMLAIYEKFSPKPRALLIGILLSCALLARLQIVFALPFFFLFANSNQPKIFSKYTFQTILGLGLFGFVFMFYNFLRFDSPFVTGYRLLPNIFDEPWFSEGQFSITYIPRHLKLFLFALPKTSAQIPYIYPSWAGLSVLLTSPTFVYAFQNSIKNRLTQVCLISIVGIALINFSYGSAGFTQFGYRYAMDFYPFVILLVTKAVIKTGIRWHHILLLILAIAVNLWGVLFINKFGWVSY